MIGQDIGTKFLLPCALDLLEVSPLADGGFYPGDLLTTVLKLPSEYWTRHSDQLVRAVTVAHRGLEVMERDSADSMFARKMVWEFRSFIWQHERKKNRILQTLTNHY